MSLGAKITPVVAQESISGGIMGVVPSPTSRVADGCECQNLITSCASCGCHHSTVKPNTTNASMAQAELCVVFCTTAPAAVAETEELDAAVLELLGCGSAVAAASLRSATLARHRLAPDSAGGTHSSASRSRLRQFRRQSCLAGTRG